MKLDEAIKIAEQGLPSGNARLATEFGKAVELLIVAGKREQEHRRGQKPTQIWPLPGETLE